MIIINIEYQWIQFYEALADKLLEFHDKRDELFALMKEIASEQPLMKYLHFEHDDWWEPKKYQIDPLTVIGVLNRKTTDANRTAMAKVFAAAFDVKVPVPTAFKGIPVLSNMSSFFYGGDELWNLFAKVLKTAEMKQLTAEISLAFDKAIAVKGNGVASVTMGLFWIRPNDFMPLDGNSRSYIASEYGITVPKTGVTGEQYGKLLTQLKSEISKHSPELTFPEVSHAAWAKSDVHKAGEEGKSTDDSNNPLQKWEASDMNLILYGTPGTGKTYSSIQYAVGIIEEKPVESIKVENYEAVFQRYTKYKEDGLIVFTTFHQSFSYEEFIEGIRPVVYSEEKTESTGEIEYEVHDGIFKAFCDKAGTPVGSESSLDLGIGKNPTVWKVSLESTGQNPTRTECLKNGHIRIGWDGYGEVISDATDYTKDGGSSVLNAFYNRMQIGDLILSCYSSKTIDAIGIVVGEPEWHDEYPHYKRLRKVKWLVKGLNEDIVNLNAGKTMTLSTVYKMSVTAFDALQMVKKFKPEVFNPTVKIPNRVFIIDEINRGNISKIFGELITLIEPSKRINASEQLRATLPYSGQSFGVPDNVYIIGTMNSADRSIAMIDTALRRRFSFIEMLPEPSTLKDVLVDGMDIAALLGTMNKRITVLLDREHTIGHSYLLPLATKPTLENLAEIFKNKIIPLLQEFFYDDYEKIQLVLGDNQKPDDSTRFIVKKTDANQLFGNAAVDVFEYYEVNQEAFLVIDAYAYF